MSTQFNFFYKYDRLAARLKNRLQKSPYPAEQKIMKTSLAVITLVFFAYSAKASTIEIQTGSYSGSGSFASAGQYQAAVDMAVSVNGATTKFVASYDNLPVSINSAAMKATINFGVATAGTWDFRTGVDFGKGGAVYLDGVAMVSQSNDMWWGGSYSLSLIHISEPTRPY